MARIGFPIDVVVIHRAHHVAIHECCVDRVGFEAGNECGGFAVTALATGRVRHGGHGAMMLEQNLCVVLLASTQRAADGIEPEQFRGLNRFGREMLVF
jgi:hypothetical protein